MAGRGMAYGQALAEAQDKGYAEADPTLDVEGHDSVHKLAVLARLAFGADVREEDVYREGVSGIEPEDLRYADSLGYTLKLLAIGLRSEKGLELRVHPALLHHNHPLADVSGAYNAACVHGDSAGEVVLTGLGAGRWPTASAVVGDLCRLALGTYRREFMQLSQFGRVPRARVVPLEEVWMRYYFRLSCADRAGVLAQVAGVLGHHEISIASCIQQASARSANEHVPVVFMTHRAREGAMQRALAEINRLDCIDGACTRMLRVQDI
jgi:homoserine dehydrogenase